MKFSIKHIIYEAPGAAIRVGIIVVAVVAFLLFYLVGFDQPFEDDPTYNEPMLTDIVIYLMWLVLVMAIGVAIWSLVRIIRASRNSSGKELGVPVRKISLAITCFTTVILLLSYILSGTDPITINGQQYDDSFWLSMAGMFIFSISVMLIVAVASVVIGKMQLSSRKRTAEKL